MEDVKRIIRGFCGEIWGDVLYIYAKEHNGIYMFDMSEKKSYGISGREKFSCIEGSLSHSSIKYGNTIYFLPGFACSVLKFSVQNKEKKEIIIQKESLSGSSGPYTVNAVIYHDYLYLFPVDYTNTIVRISLISDEVNYIRPEGWNRLPAFDAIPNYGYFYGCAQNNVLIYRACKFGPYIQKYNLVTNKTEYLLVNGIVEKLRHVVHDGKYLWILPMDSRQIIKWDEKRKQIVEIYNFDKYLTNPMSFLQAINVVDNNIYVTFSESNEIIEINMENRKDNQIYCFDCMSISGFMCKNGTPFIDEIKINAMGDLCFLPNNANGMVIWHKDRTVTFCETSISSFEILKDLHPKLTYKESMCNVEYFVNQSGGESQKSNSNFIGENIWNVVSHF